MPSLAAPGWDSRTQGHLLGEGLEAPWPTFTTLYTVSILQICWYCVSLCSPPASSSWSSSWW